MKTKTSKGDRNVLQAEPSNATTVSTARAAGGTPLNKIETLDVLVLAGGVGVEREVSLQSGQAVYEALCRLGHRAKLHDVQPEDLSVLDMPVDFVFIALHGEFGEDGTVQKALEDHGLCYAGSGVASSRMAMDKAGAKRAFERAGLPTPPWIVVGGSNRDAWSASFAPPLVVKPVASGSSVDTSIARDAASVQGAVDELVKLYGVALIERYIAGPELTVGILGDQPLPVCQIRTRREFYDYHAKYIDDDTEYLFDVALPDDLLKDVQRMSLAAHQAIGCRVFSRIDWMVDAETHQPYILEVNTIPGFTSHSLLPKAAARVGIGFDDLCQRIIELSMAPHWA